MQGKGFIASVTRWVDAVHALPKRPVTIYSRLVAGTQLKLQTKAGTAWPKAAGALVDLPMGSSLLEIYLPFKPDTTGGDVVLAKSRYYAGFGNGSEESLSTQNIDTVVLSVLSASGVLLATAYRLADLDYNVSSRPFPSS